MESKWNQNGIKKRRKKRKERGLYFFIIKYSSYKETIIEVVSINILEKRESIFCYRMSSSNLSHALLHPLKPKLFYS